MASSVLGLSLGHKLSARPLQPIRWSGFALGAEGQFTLYTEHPAQAKRVLEQCFAEIRRLESLFSLYQDQSELCQLNRKGYLQNPAPEWQPLLQAIDQAHARTQGLFDPSVQTLWKAYEAHFRAKPEASKGPEPSVINAALARSGWKKVAHSPSEIRLHPGMSLTLNGIAQGYITDRITDILQTAGYSQVLIELGETRALGIHPEQRPWQIGIQKADNPAELHEIASLENQALATSGSYGSPFSQDGHFHHLIHPQTGQPSVQWKSLSVIAPTATEADALSTGLSFANSGIIEQLCTHTDSLHIIKQS